MAIAYSLEPTLMWPLRQLLPNWDGTTFAPETRQQPAIAQPAAFCAIIKALAVFQPRACANKQDDLPGHI